MNKKKKSSYIVIAIISLVLLISIYRYKSNFLETYNEIKNVWIEDPSNSWFIIISFIVIMGILTLIGILAKNKPKILEKIMSSIEVIWLEFWAPFTVLIIMFLGWIHDRYPYQSYFAENLTQSFTSLAGSINNIYNRGSTISGYVWIIMWVGLIALTTSSVIDIWKKKKKEKPKSL